MNLWVSWACRDCCWIEQLRQVCLPEKNNRIIPPPNFRYVSMFPAVWWKQLITHGGLLINDESIQTFTLTLFGLKWEQFNHSMTQSCAVVVYRLIQTHISNLFLSTSANPPTYKYALILRFDQQSGQTKTTRTNTTTTTTTTASCSSWADTSAYLKFSHLTENTQCLQHI